MGLKPTAARWFEVLTPCDELARTVEALAATGQVQIEIQRALERPPSDAPAVELDEYRRLFQSTGRYWPRPDFRARMTPGAPREIVARAITVVEAWTRDAEPLIARLERLDAEREQLVFLGELAAAAPDALARLAPLARAGPGLHARLLALDRRRRVPDLPRVIAWAIPGSEHVFVALLAPKEELEAAERVLIASEALSVDIPRDVTADSVGARRAEVDAEIAGITSSLEDSARARRLPTVLADVQRLEWFLNHVPPLDRTRHFALVTGWTADPAADTLRRALDDAGVHALLRFPAVELDPPIILRNPRWAKPFEHLARLIGTPSSVEADPSVVLVVLAPLLFGFMFADVGQGAVLVVAGLLLRRRAPLFGMLVPGGLAAMLGGAVFGCVFAREDVLPPLWVHPLREPLAVLGASVALGALVLVLGLALSAVEARWRHALGQWLESEGTLLLVYLGLLVALVHPGGFAVAGAAALLHVVAAGISAHERRVPAAFGALGHLLERTLQLGVNTLSFARVGAFALAHAGLSVAIVELARATGGGVASMVALVLGNVLVLVLEGLVVGIQTTRLVLFEFFTRFVRAEGRAFVPLLPPASDEAMTGAMK